MCFSCAGKAGSMDRMPRTLHELRSTLRRDRRLAERRYGKADTRVFQYDRRNGDRREGRTIDEGWMVIDDDMILEIEELTFNKTDDDQADGWSELTRILDLQ